MCTTARAQTQWRWSQNTRIAAIHVRSKRTIQMCACQQYPRFAYKLRSHREKALWWLMATMMSTSSSSCREISSMARSSTQSSILRAWRPSLIRVLTKVPSSLNWTFVLRNQANMSDLSCSTVLPKKTVKQSIHSTTQMKISLPS